MTELIRRRSFLAGLVAALAAPAIVRAATLMPVRGIIMAIDPVVGGKGQLWMVAAEGGFMYSDELSEILQEQIVPLTNFQWVSDMEIIR